jgi:hypothetical protein
MAVSEDDGTYRLRNPEVGAVETLVGLGLFYHLVDLATPVLADGLEPVVPGLVPEPFTTGTRIFVWFVVGVTLFSMATTKRPFSTHEFDSEADLASFLDERRPNSLSLRWNFLRALGGLAFAVLTYEQFVPSFLAVNRFLVTVVGTGSVGLSLVDALWLVVFFVSFGLFAGGFDRLLVGVMRTNAYYAVAPEE